MAAITICSDFGPPPQIKSDTVSTLSLSISHEVMGPDEAGRRHPVSEVRGSGREELPHVQGQWRPEGDPPRLRSGRRPGGAIPRPPFQSIPNAVPMKQPLFLFCQSLFCHYRFPLSISSVQFSRSAMSNSLRPHGLQHARLPVHHHLLEVTQTHVH